MKKYITDKLNMVKQFGYKLLTILGFLVGCLITAIILLGVWICVGIYMFFEWLASEDGYTHRNYLSNNVSKDNSKLNKEIDEAFAPKPLPKPYSPTDNPLYQIEESSPAKIVAETIIDNIIENTKKSTHYHEMDERYNQLRKSKKSTKQLTNKSGKSVKKPKKSVTRKIKTPKTPVTRYGVKTSQRFGNQ